jgi:hypothetical protein
MKRSFCWKFEKRKKAKKQLTKKAAAKIAIQKKQEFLILK